MHIIAVSARREPGMSRRTPGKKGGRRKDIGLLTNAPRFRHQDLSDPASVAEVFEQTTKAFGPVSTVIYNGSSPSRLLLHPQARFHFAHARRSSLPAYPRAVLPIPNSPLSLPLSMVLQSQNIAVYSAYRAAQLLLESKTNALKYCLYIGNVLHLPGHVLPESLVLGLGKSSMASVTEIAAKAYAGQGIFCESTFDASFIFARCDPSTSSC